MIFRQMLVEGLERRDLMATDTAPRLLSISPNVGTSLDLNASGATANVLRESPSEIVFRFDGSQSIDPTSLSGIQIRRSGSASPITPAFLGFGESQRVVVARFSEPLPDDAYQILVFGAGSTNPIRNAAGEELRATSGTFNSYTMNLELGAKIIAVVPQPTRVAGFPGVNTSRNQIEVYFNDDDLNAASAQNPNFYQLIRTSDSVNPGDDVRVNPSAVAYDPLLNKAVLTFTGANDLLSAGSGTFRLRIGSSQSAIRTLPLVVPAGADIGDTLTSASNTLGTLSTDRSFVINEQVAVTPANQLGLNYPGSEADPGNRDIQDERSLLFTADANPNITTRYYSFLLNQPYGQDGQGRTLTSSISDVQRQRVREVFEFYSYYLGIQFIEATGTVAPDGSPTLQVVVGDLLSNIIGVPGGPGGFVTATRADLNNQVSLAILDGSELWDNDFGYGTQRDNLTNDSIDPTRLTNPLMIEANRSFLLLQTLQSPLDVVGPNFFIESMRVIGSLLGLGQTHDQAPGTIQGFEPLLGRVENPLEQIFPGPQDIARGQHLYRPDNRDVDVYRFTIPNGQRGSIAVQSIAEGLADSSSLDTYLKLYQRDAAGVVTLIASNDNYLSDDSLIRFELQGRTGVEFFIAITAKGNENFDPSVTGSGSGGVSSGRYQLRVDYRPVSGTSILDQDGVPSALDGDGDGKAGGEFNYWFKTAAPIDVAAVGQPRTIYVDKNALPVATTGTGSLANPFRSIQTALSTAVAGDIVRVLGVDPSVPLTSRRAYEIGDGGPSRPILDDGRDLIVPQGVSLMVDAGAIFKLSATQILVGSDTATSNRSGATIQVLGTPGNSVYFTAYNDESLGVDTNNTNTTAQRGSWGGIEIRNDVDREQGRTDPELAGIFLNYIGMADIRFGGGSVGQGSLTRVVDPIHLNSARPTILSNVVTQSGNAGISADPASFEETLFTEARYQFMGSFTPDYTRVGPVIRGNRITNSSTNGLLVRIDTLPGQTLETLDVAARLKSTDIVYYLGETLTVNGTPGGAILESVRPDVTRVTTTLTTGGTLLAATAYEYRLTYVDRNGQEGLPSTSITRTTTGVGGIRLGNLPPASGDFVGRRLYRRVGSSGPWILAAELDKSSVSYTDAGRSLATGITLSSATTLNRGRTDASLVIDPGIVIKSQGGRIEVGINAQLIAEGTANNPIIFTSRADDRYGAGATFDTNNDGNGSVGRAGDWSGILGLHLSTVSIDSAVITFGGGASRVPGGFGSFNAIELHQSEARIANSLIENNASGAGTATTTRRAARGINDAAAIYASGSQPIIVNNIIRNNSVIIADLLTRTFQNGETAAISIDANSLTAVPKLDYGRSIGAVSIIDTGSGNAGPLVSGNRLSGNAINGMRVRGATLTTESVWDDTDIVHVVQKEIVVPDFNIYGGLRLQSRGDESLVVKLAGATAGFTATGRPIGVTDRIGGGLQIIGSPGFPVILTALSDDTIGAGFTPAGGSSVDTDNNGPNSPGVIEVLLPTGPEVNRGTLIDNDVAQATPGFFSFQPAAGGGSSGSGGITAEGRTQTIINQNVIFSYLNMVDVGSNGGAVSLANTTITLVPTLVSPDLVASEGNFVGNGGAIVNWRVETSFDNGRSKLNSVLRFTSASPLGNIRFINYLDEDVASPSDDLLYTRGTPGQDDFRVFTVDGAQRFGFSQAGVFTPGPGLQNATYVGWAANRFPSLSSSITGAAGSQYSIAGTIDLVNLPVLDDANLGQVNGPADVTSALAWDFDPTATTATITTFLELLPSEFQTASLAGEWRGIVLDAYGNDRNVDTTYEYEPDLLGANGTNNIPTRAQDIGNLAKDIESGDENVRLGITLSGAIARPNDVDVYRFTASAGSMVWFDIDRTSGNLDTIVELLDKNGKVIALSDNSLAESLRYSSDPLRLPTSGVTYYDDTAVTDDRVYPLDQSAFSQRNAIATGAQVDFQGVNPLDAGFRISLPGTPGSTSEYFVRVRSSNLNGTEAPGSIVGLLTDAANVGKGITSGAYRLQLRLQQLDEIGGSTIRFSEIRFATRGIDVQGGPLHSPLIGELGEQDSLESSSAPGFGANSSNISIGNIYNYDRGAVSIAGNLVGLADVDWFRFTVNRELASNLSSFKHQSLVFDIDYADALGRPDTSLWVFQADANGNPTQLVLLGRDSDITDDKASPNQGANANDITRGSFGSGDAFIGSSELPNGNYVVAVTSNSLSASVADQYVLANSGNPLARLEPLDSIQRISEDRFTTTATTGRLASTFLPPLQTAFPVAPLGTTANVYPNAVPYTLADVNAFVARTNPSNGQNSQLLLANAQTGAKEAEGGNRANGGIFAQRIRDIAASPAGLLVGPAFDPNGQLTDANTGVFSRLNADGSASGTSNATITTFEVVPNAAAFDVRQVWQGVNNPVGIGTTFTSVTYGDDNNNNLTMFGVAQRGAGGNLNRTFDEAVITPVNGTATATGISRGTGIFDNILYRLDPATQAALSPTAAGLGNRAAPASATATGTNVREFGIFADIDSNFSHYVRRSNNFADTIVVRRPANGDIVGITEVGNFIYGVTDAGELWRLNQTSYDAGFRGAELIATNVPTNLTGLSKGPRNLTIDTPKSEFILSTSKRIDSGSFQLSFDGQTTTRLPYDASAAVIQAALEALTTVGVGNVRVTGGSGIGSGSLDESAMAISLVGTLAGSPLQVTLAPGNTLSITPAASIVETVPFSGFFRMKIPTETTAGSYRLQYSSLFPASNDPPITLPYNATAAQIQAAILALPSIVTANIIPPPIPDPLPPPAVTVTVRQTAQGVFDISFGGTAVPFGISLTLEPISTMAQPVPGTPSYVITTAAPSIAPTQPAFYQLRYSSGPGVSDPSISFSSNDTTAQIQAKILSSLSIAAANTATPGAITVTVTSTVAGVFNVALGGTGLPSTAALSLQESLFSSQSAPAPTIVSQAITRYSNILFGIEGNGTLHAFDLNGLPQFIFTNGQSSTITSQTANGFNDSLSSIGEFGTDVQGIDFSILDVNLFHVTSERQDEAGHGTLQNFNSSRLNSANAGNSLYFGLRPNDSGTGKQAGVWNGIYDLGAAGLNQTYALPGGARGAVESNPIDLAGYTPDDQPTLYFNYFLQTQDSNSTLTDDINMADAFRVYGYGPEGTWILLATNNSANNNQVNVLNQFAGAVDEYDVPISGNQDALGRSYRTQELFDQPAGSSTGGANWRQARINLAPLAGMQDARIRFEFSTAGDFRTGDPLRAGIELTAIAGDRFQSGDNFTIAAPTTSPFLPGTPINFVFDVDGTLAPAPNVIPVNATMTTVQVRDAIRLALARVLNGNLAGEENVIPYPVYQNTVRLYNYEVLDSGPLHATTGRVGDVFGPYTGGAGSILNGFQATKDFQRAFQTTQNNGFAGVYIDDVIIGFAERGEQVLRPAGTPATTGFIPTPFYEELGGPNGVARTQTEAGTYQLEIRTSAEYGDQGASDLLALERTFGTNERLSDQVSIIVSKDIPATLFTAAVPAVGAVDGDTFTIDDGYSRVTFEFDIVTALTDPSNVTQGNIPVPLVIPQLSPNANAGTVARAIRDAINSPAGQAALRVTAGIRGQILSSTGLDLQRDSSNIVDLFSSDTSIPIASVSTTSAGGNVPNALSDAFAPNPIDPFGQFPTFYPPIQVGGVVVSGQEAKFDLLPFGEDKGDSNRYRDQGQIVLSSNTIIDSSDFGIVVDAASTATSVTNPNARQLPGVVRNTNTLNIENLVPGVVIVNNLLVRNQNGGITLSGGATTQAGVPPFAVARVINNTIYGGETARGTGILVNEGASPTLLNNILANNILGLSAASVNAIGGSTTVTGGSIFSGNTTNIPAGAVGGTADITLATGEVLFNDLTNDKFYLASQSRAIDSSLGSLLERPGLTSVKSGIGRSPNAMIAPDRDIAGVLRQASQSTNTAGQGQNIYIDRGAVERADFAGPIAFLRRPLDNSIDAGDINPNVSYVKLAPSTPSLDYFEILLDESQGTGVNPITVTAASVLLTENGRLLIEGLDYIFGYSANSRTIRLTPLSGIWRNDSAYEITLNNKPRLLVTAPNGSTPTNGTQLDGTQLVSTTANGTVVTFEYDSGFALQVPLTSTLEVPSEGSAAGGLRDGDTFVISNGNTGVNFELTTDASTFGSNEAVLIPANASATAVRDAILAVLVSPTARIQSLQLSPKAVGSDRIHLGTNRNHSIQVGSSGLLLSGALEGVVDGQSFTYTSGANAPVTFEFNRAGGSLGSGSREIVIAGTDTNDDIATKIAVALASVVTGGVVPLANAGGGVVSVGGNVGDALDVANSALSLLGTPGVTGGIQLEMPISGALIAAAQTFTIRTATGSATFEFSKGQIVSGQNRRISVADSDTAAVIASKVLAAINTAGLGLVATSPTTTSVRLNESIGTQFTLGTAPFAVTGVAGGAIAIPIVPSPNHSEALVAGEIVKTINALPKPQFQGVRAVSTGGGSVVIEGFSSITNVTNSAIPTIADFAGNALQGNRANDFTQFTIAMPNSTLDFGDASFQTLSASDGASHILYPVDVATLVLGTTVTADLDGQPFPMTDSDDGVTFLSPFNANSPAANIEVIVTGTGYLDAWIDWNGNGVFELTASAGERVIDSQPVTTGVNRFSVATPTLAVAGSPFMRFRLSSTGGLQPTGMAVGGEVEDYQITVYPGRPPIANTDPTTPSPQYSLNEDSGDLVVASPGILSNDTDADVGQTLAVLDSNTSLAGIQPLRGPVNGTLVAINSNGSFTYRPNLHFAGTDTFTYYAVDSTGLRSVNPATVTITVAEVNDAPEFTLGQSTVTLNEDETNSLGPVGRFSVPNFAAGRPGPIAATSESLQTLTYNLAVAANQTSFFSTLPTIDATTGLLSFRLAPDVNRLFPNGANIPVVVTLSDNGSPIATSVPQTFTVDIVPVNDAPIVNGNSFTTYEDSPITPTEASLTARDLPGPATAIDESANQTLTVVAFQAVTSGGGSVTRLLPNSFNYRPAPNFVGQDTFTYDVTDGVANSPIVRGTVTITVLAVNDAPVFTVPATTIDVLEDQGSTINSSGVQTQVPISIPGFATNVRPGPVTAIDEVDQILDFTVVAQNPSFYLVQPTIVRSTTDPTQATLSFTLRPHLNRDTPAGSTNQLVVTLRDRGPNNPAILPPNPNARPADVNTSAPQTFSINIIPVNDPPIPATPNVVINVAEDNTLSLTLNQVLNPSLTNRAVPGPIEATDEVGQSLSITRIDGFSVRGGTLSAILNNAGAIISIQYVPRNNYVGPDSFTYTLTDNGGGTTDSAVGTVSINVTPINDAPVFVSGGNVTVLEDSAAYSAPWATGIATGPSNADDELTGLTSPVIAAQTIRPFIVSTTSPEKFLSGPSVSTTGVLTFQLRPNVNGDAVVSVTAVDSGTGTAPNINQSAATTFTISITPVNDAPVFTPGPDVTVLEDAGAVSLPWATSILPAAGLGLSPQQALDELNQLVSFITTNDNAALFSIPPAISPTGRLTFTTALNAFGSAVVTTFARDTGSAVVPNISDSPAVTFTINLTAVNDAPIGVNDNYSTTEDAPLISSVNGEVVVNDSDPDGDPFAVIPGQFNSTQGASVTLNADGSFTYDPTNTIALQALRNGQTLNDTFTYRLTDNQAISLPVTVTVTVSGINDAPTTVDDSLVISANTTTILDVLANDRDVDSSINRQSVVIGLVPLNGRATALTDGRISYTPNPGYRGPDSFTYRVRDDIGATSRETTVQLSMNSAPVANNDSVIMLINTPTVIDVVANDRDPDVGDTINPQSVVIVTQSPNVTATVLANGNIELRPATGFIGAATVTYTIADNNGLRSAPGIIGIQVVRSLYQNPINQLDVNNDGFISPIDALLVINYLNSDPRPPLSSTRPPFFLDVDGDGVVFPIDALLVINYLNEEVTAGGIGEGESAGSARLTSVSAPKVELPFGGQIDVEVLDQASVQSYVNRQSNRAVSTSVEAAFASSQDSFAHGESDSIRAFSAVASDVSIETLRRKSNQTFESALEGVLDELGVC